MYINTRERYNTPNKKHIGKYKTGELRFKTKDQVNNLIDYNDGKKGNNIKKTLNFIPQLGYKEFILFLEKEMEKQHFNSKTIEYYEKLLKRLDEVKILLNDKIKFKYYTDKIEQALLESSQKNNFNYFEEKIKENSKYSKISNILDSQYIQTNLLSRTKEESFLSVSKVEKHKKQSKISTNLDELLELLYQGKLESSIHLMKVKNKKLKEIYKNDSDLEKYLKGKVVGKGAQQKINNIYDNLDYDTATLLAIKNFKSGDIEKLEKIKNYLNSQKGNPENNIDIKLIRAIKLEIQLLLQEENNRKKIDSIINILENSQEKKILIASLSEIRHLLETKKETKSLKYFMYQLIGGSKRKRNTNINYPKRTQLTKIINNIEKIDKRNKTKNYLIDIMQNKLNELQK